MKKTIVDVFDRDEDAMEAVKRLLEGGVAKEHIHALSRGEDSPEKSFEIEKENESILFWGKQGALWGGLFGLLAGGIFSIVPGFGPLVAAGPVVSSLAGFLGGAATFGSASALAAWLADFSMEELEAHRYEKLLKEGKALVIVHAAGDELKRAEDILEKMGKGELKIH